MGERSTTVGAFILLDILAECDPAGIRQRSGPPALEWSYADLFWRPCAQQQERHWPDTRG
jgi:hypothetical protein